MLAQQRLVRLEELERLQLVAALLEPLHDVADQATLHPVRLNHDVRALHLHRGRSGARRGVAQRRGADTERHAELGESEHGQGSGSKEKKIRNRAGAAGVRDVCGTERAMCCVRLAFVFITSKAS